MNLTKALFVVAALPALAHAQAPEGAAEEAPVEREVSVATPSPGTSSKTDGFVLPKGKLVLDAYLEMNLSSDMAFEPVSLAPDLWYGVTDDLTLGLVHSGIGATGVLGSVGDSLCLVGESHGCAKVYNNLGLAGRYRIARPWTIDAGVYVNSFADPFQLAVKLGIDGRWVWNKLSLEVRPSIFFGVTNRDAGNEEVLVAPATASYLVAPRVALALQAALVLPFTDTSDTWTLPLSLAARFAATERFGVGLSFTFPALIGGTSTADFRTLVLGGSYAF